MNRKVANITVAVMAISFLFLLGTVGAVEMDSITMTEGIPRMVIGLVIMAICACILEHCE